MKNKEKDSERLRGKKVRQKREIVPENETFPYRKFA